MAAIFSPERSAVSQYGMKKILRLLSWVLRAALFLLLLLFALKNTDPVTLKFFFERSWQVPLVLLLLLFLVGGATLGLIAAMGRLFAERREILALRKELKSLTDSREPSAAKAIEGAPPTPVDAAG